VQNPEFTPLELLAYTMYQMETQGSTEAFVRWWCMDPALRQTYMDKATTTYETWAHLERRAQTSNRVAEEEATRDEDKNWAFFVGGSDVQVALDNGDPFGPWGSPETAIENLVTEFGTSDPAKLSYTLAFGDPKDGITLDAEQLDRRSCFWQNCGCHINPPCNNCIEHGELFPEQY
jgi:hypothetical protein